MRRRFFWLLLPVMLAAGCGNSSPKAAPPAALDAHGQTFCRMVDQAHTDLPDGSTTGQTRELADVAQAAAAGLQSTNQAIRNATAHPIPYTGTPQSREVQLLDWQHACRTAGWSGN